MNASGTTFADTTLIGEVTVVVAVMTYVAVGGMVVVVVMTYVVVGVTTRVLVTVLVTVEDFDPKPGP